MSDTKRRVCGGWDSPCGGFARWTHREPDVPDALVYCDEHRCELCVEVEE